jgi:putative phage-type endonuclease
MTALLRPADTLFIDRLLNRGKSPLEICSIAQHALEAPVPLQAIEARVVEREQQKKIAAKLPPGVQQRTPEWYAARDKIVTASDFYAAAFGTDSAKRNFVTKKCGEAAPFLGSCATNWGQKYEDVARMMYELYMSCTVREYGLLLHPTIDIMGASPDGYADFSVLIEIKNPYSKTLMDVPPEYFAQMQGQMEVCGLNACDFVVCRVRELEEPEFWEQFDTAHKEGYGSERFGAVSTTKGPDRKYSFSTPGMTPEQLKRWIDSNTDDGVDISVHEVFDFRVTRINRDDEYIARMIDGLRDTWEKVLEGRRNPQPASDKKKTTFANDFAIPQLKGFAFKQPR